MMTSYRIIQDDQPVAWAGILREVIHYVAVYAQDWALYYTSMYTNLHILATQAQICVTMRLSVNGYFSRRKKIDKMFTTTNFAALLAIFRNIDV